MADIGWFFGICLPLLIAGNAVSGHDLIFTSGPDEQVKECLITVETIQQHLKKDSVQKIAFTTLKEACQHVFPGDHCDQMVKAALLQLNNFASTKLQPKKVCSANFTGQELAMPAKDGNLHDSIEHLICAGVIRFVEAEMFEVGKGIIKGAAEAVCSAVPTEPTSLKPLCIKLMESIAGEILGQIFNIINVDIICNLPKNMFA